MPPSVWRSCASRVAMSWPPGGRGPVEPASQTSRHVLFNSLEFLIFLPIVLIVYYLLPHRWQNAFLVLASCVFYASWDWRFLFPLLFSTTTDYLCAARMEASVEHGEPQERRKKYLLISLITNLGLLGFFKYCNFFVDSVHDLGTLLGLQLPTPALRV